LNRKTYRVNTVKALLEKHAQRAYRLGLVWGASGNMSMRADADSFFITASGKSLGDITGRDVVRCRIDKDKPVKNASMEWGLHRGIYRNRSDACAVFHSQPPYSTLIACAKNRNIKTVLIPEAI